MPEPLKPTALNRRLIYANPWVNLYADDVRFPNGRVIERHHLVDFEHPAVMAVIRDGDDRFAMVQVCRYPTGRTEWEFPAGRLEAGESVIEAARREALEETGCRTCEHEVIYQFNPMNGISNQVFYVVRCRVLSVGSHLDRDEIDQVGWFTEGEILEKIHTNEVKDGFTLTAFLLNRLLTNTKSA